MEADAPNPRRTSNWNAIGIEKSIRLVRKEAPATPLTAAPPTPPERMTNAMRKQAAEERMAQMQAQFAAMQAMFEAEKEEMAAMDNVEEESAVICQAAIRRRRAVDGLARARGAASRLEAGVRGAQGRRRSADLRAERDAKRLQERRRRSSISMQALARGAAGRATAREAEAARAQKRADEEEIRASVIALAAAAVAATESRRSAALTLTAGARGWAARRPRALAVARAAVAFIAKLWRAVRARRRLPARRRAHARRLKYEAEMVAQARRERIQAAIDARPPFDALARGLQREDRHAPVPITGGGGGARASANPPSLLPSPPLTAHRSPRAQTSLPSGTRAVLPSPATSTRRRRRARRCTRRRRRRRAGPAASAGRRTIWRRRPTASRMSSRAAPPPPSSPPPAASRRRAGRRRASPPPPRAPARLALRSWACRSTCGWVRRPRSPTAATTRRRGAARRRCSRN